MRRLLAIVPALLLFSTAVRAEEAPTKPRIGPFIVASEDGRNELRVGLIAQLRLSYFKLDGVEAGDGLTVQARRIRPILAARLLEDLLRFKLQLSTAPGSVELIDLWIELRPMAGLRIRLGAYKIPFTQYRRTSFSRLMTTDWARISRNFGAERQWGLAVHNEDVRRQPLSYHVGLFAGWNARAAHAVALPIINYRESVENPSDLTSVPRFPSVHPEIVGRLAYRTPGMNLSRLSDDRGGAPRVWAGVSVAADLGPVPTQDYAQRFAPELIIKAWGFTVHSVVYVSTAKTTVDETLVIASIGALAQLSYRVTPMLELTAAYDYSRFTDSILEDARAHAGSVVADASEDDRAALVVQYRGAGERFELHEAALGFNVFLIGDDLSWQTDVAWQGPRFVSGGHRDDVLLRTQLTLSL